MMAISPPDDFRIQWSFRMALLASLLVHGAILLIPVHPPPVDERAARRLEATFVQAVQTPPARPVPVVLPAPSAVAKPDKQSPKKRVLAIGKQRSRVTAPATPKWTVAQKEDMNAFLRELDSQARQAPSLAQRSLAMAREIGRQQAQQEREGSEVLERLPNSPPVDPFSLEMYLDALVRKLNKSAAYVGNDPRSKGIKAASVEVRLNPDGSLKSFRILNAGDQQDQIAFVKSVVEQAVPFSPFPPDIRRSARSLAMIICIMPARFGAGGFGFTRNPGGHGC